MHTEGESDSGIKLKSNWRKFDSALISRIPRERITQQKNNLIQLHLISFTLPFHSYQIQVSLTRAIYFLKLLPIIKTRAQLILYLNFQPELLIT